MLSSLKSTITIGSLVKSQWIALIAVSNVVLGFPAMISGIKTKHLESGISISAHRASPPFAALEDVGQDSQSQIDQSENSQLNRELDQAKASSEAIVLVAEEPFAWQELAERRDVIIIEGGEFDKQSPEVVQLVAALQPNYLPKVNTFEKLNASSFSKSASPSMPRSMESRNQNIQEVGKKNTTETRASIQQQQKPDKNPISEPKSVPVLISGHVELVDGLAFLGNEHRIKVYRELAGRKVEETKVNVQDGFFKIKVSEAKGRLVAVLENSGKQIEGEGELLLAGLTEQQIKKTKAEDVLIRIASSAFGINGKIISAYSFNENKIPVHNAEVDIGTLGMRASTDRFGRFEFSDVAGASTYLVRARIKDSWGSLQKGRAGKSIEIKMFSNKMMDSLLTIVAGKEKAAELKEFPIIWGQVLINGHPVGGASVEMAGDVTSRPIYFNSLQIPELDLEKTSQNGLFAFVGVEEGVHQVRALIDGRVIAGELLQAESGFVSEVKLNMTPNTEEVSIRLAHGFSAKEAGHFLVKSLGGESIFEGRGEAFVSAERSKDVRHYELDPGGEYLVSRISMPGNNTEISAPIFERSWFDQALQSADFDVDLKLGSVVLYVDQPVTDLNLWGVNSETSKLDRIFFDHQGRTVGEKDWKGGGIIVGNIDPGLHTMAFRRAKNSRIETHIIISDPWAVSVIY